MNDKLRHPIRATREPFGTAGLIIACVALIAALGGTALAAKGALTGKQKKEVEKIAKKFAGTPGANGAPGIKGDPGSGGSNGSPGAAGKSVVTSNAVVPGECPTGTTGTKFEVEGSGSPTHVCSGTNGKNGTTGFTETLPSEKTETGTWFVGPSVESGAATLSFNIPLEAGLQAGEVHFVKEGETAPAGCTGGTAAVPTAEPGNLCVYVSEAAAPIAAGLIKSPATLQFEEAGPTGALLFVAFEGTGEALGTWAVTAE